MSSEQPRGPPRGGPGKPPPARHSPAVAPGGAEGGVAAKFTGPEHEVSYEELGIDKTVRPFGWKRRPLPLLTVCDARRPEKERMEHEFLDYRALRPPFWFTHRGHRKTFIRKEDRKAKPGEKILYHFITTYFGDIFSNDPYDWTGILLDSTWVIRQVDADKRDIWLEYPKGERISTDNSFLFYGDKDPVRVLWCLWPEEGVTVENYLVDIGDRAVVSSDGDDFIERMYTRVKLHGQIVDTGLKRDQLAFRIPEQFPHTLAESKRWNDVKNHPHFSKYITEYPGGYYAYLRAPEKTPHWGFMWKSGEPKPTYIRWQKDLSTRGKPEDAKPEKHGYPPSYYLDRLYDYWTRKHRGEIHEIIATVKPDQTPLSMPHGQSVFKPQRFTRKEMKKKLYRLKVILENKKGQPAEQDDGNQAAGGHDSDHRQHHPASDQPSKSGRSSPTNDPRGSGSGGRNSGNQDTQSPHHFSSVEERRGGQQHQADSRGRRSPTRGRWPSGSRPSGQPQSSTGAIPKIRDTVQTQQQQPYGHMGQYQPQQQQLDNINPRQYPQNPMSAPPLSALGSAGGQSSPSYGRNSPPVGTQRRPPSYSGAGATFNTGTGHVTPSPQHTAGSHRGSPYGLMGRESGIPSYPQLYQTEPTHFILGAGHMPHSYQYETQEHQRPSSSFGHNPQQQQPHHRNIHQHHQIPDALQQLQSVPYGHMGHSQPQQQQLHNINPRQYPQNPMSAPPLSALGSAGGQFSPSHGYHSQTLYSVPPPPVASNHSPVFLPEPQGYIFSNFKLKPIYFFPEEPRGNTRMFYSNLKDGKPVFLEGHVTPSTRYVPVTMGGKTKKYPTMTLEPAADRGGTLSPTSRSRKRRRPKERDRPESPLRSRRSDSTEPSDKRTKK